MAIGTVTWAAAVVGTTGSLTPAQPSPAAGDLMLCFCYDYAQLTSWTQPIGWSTHKNVAVASSGTYAIFYKVATGSEGTATITCAATGTGNSRLARICKIPGAGSTLTAGTQEAETTSTYANAGVTPAVDNSLVVFFGGVKDCITNSETDGFGTPTGGTNVGTWTMNSRGTTGGSDAAFGIATALQTTAAATGSISSTLQASQATYAGISYTFAVEPSSTRSGTATSLTGTATLGTAAGRKAVSATVASLTGTGALGTATGRKASSGTVADLSGAGAYSTATGFATTGESRSGTATALSGSGAYASQAGTKDAWTATLALYGSAALSTAAGAKAVAWTATDLVGSGFFSTADGTAAAAPTVRSGTAMDLTAWTSTGTGTVSPWLGGTWAGLTWL